MAAAGLVSRITANSEAIYKVLADMGSGPWLGAVDEVKPGRDGLLRVDMSSDPASVNGLFNG
jgi:hypothetical protein